MGILRTDRVSGLGGANAIKGSVYFPYVASGSYFHQYQQIQSDDYAFGTGAFTLECWYHMDGDGGHTDSVGNIILLTGTNSLASTSKNGVWLASRNDNKFEARVYYASGSWNMTMTSTNAFPRQTWHHLAMVRSGSSVKLYVNGVQEASGSNSSDLDTSVSTSLYIGAQGNATTTGALGSRGITGYVSNVRVSNEALYTAAFTPPVGELQKLSSTITLCNQSPSDVLKEETGKTITLYRKTLDHQLPLATRFTPNSPVGFSTTTDVGTQFGTTFDGVTTFDSQAYFVPPSGNTRERNRGRGLIFGGYSASPAGHVSTIQSIEIQSFGNAQDFGDLTSIRSQIGGVSSKTRAISCGGGNDTPSDYTPVNICEFVTIANSSNTTDFGDLTVARTPYKASSNDTRGIIFGGYAHPSNLNTIDFITIATAGNATDFGDEIDTNRAGGSCSSTTRGIVAGGFPYTNRISFVTIATTGDAQDFGDLLNNVFGLGGVSNNTRGVFGGGGNAPDAAALNVIQFITMASTGDATDFGDLNTTEKVGNRGTSNSIRGLFCGGYDGATFVNSISAINIATTGNAVDFGDISGTLRFASAVSDSHGGLE